MFVVGVTPISSGFCIHKPSSATKLAKKEKHLVLSPLRGAFLSFKLLLFRMSLPGARSRGFSSRPLFFWGCLTSVFLLAFASTSLHRLLSLQKKTGSVSAARGFCDFQIII